MKWALDEAVLWVDACDDQIDECNDPHDGDDIALFDLFGRSALHLASLPRARNKKTRFRGLSFGNGLDYAAPPYPAPPGVPDSHALLSPS